MSKPRGRPFQPGNTFGKGRPKGRPNKGTAAALKLLDQHAVALTIKCISLALQGDTRAMGMVMDRVARPRRANFVRFTLPPIKTAADIAAAHDGLIKLVGKGQLTPEEALIVSSLLEQRRKALETVEFESRLVSLEPADAAQKEAA